MTGRHRFGIEAEKGSDRIGVEAEKRGDGTRDYEGSPSTRGGGC